MREGLINDYLFVTDYPVCWIRCCITVNSYLLANSSKSNISYREAAIKYECLTQSNFQSVFVGWHKTCLMKYYRMTQNHAGFEILTAVLLRIKFFCYVTPCCSVDGP